MSIRESAIMVAGVVIGCGISYMLLKRRSVTEEISPQRKQCSGRNSYKKNSSTKQGQNDLEEDGLNGQHDLEKDGPNDTGWTDIIILHAKKDQIAAEDCKDFLMYKSNIPDLKVELPQDFFQPGKLLLLEINTILDTCRLVFIYPFINTESDGVATYGKQINLLKSLEDQEKNARIIPLQVGDADISADLKIFKPLQYNGDINDSEFKKKLNKLVTYWRTTLP